MEDLGDIWRNLGTNKLTATENKPQGIDFERKLNDVQSELYGTIDALLARIRSLEQQMAEMKVNSSNSASNEFTNVFDLVSPEELLGRAPQPIEPLTDDEVISVKGFVAPAPIKKETEKEPDAPLDLEVSLPTEDEPLSGVETIDLDMYELLGDEDPNDLDASEIITFIESYGGVLNQEMKKKELLRKEISDKDRKLVYALLEKCGIKTYKANKFRTFFYIGSEEEGKTKYETYMSQK